LDERALRVLLVESDPVDVMNVQRAFRRSHVLNPLIVAASGPEAIDLLRSGSVPTARLIVLLELSMPGMSGIEFLRELRRDPALTRVPVVVLTTSEAQRERIESYELDVAGYISKPVTFLNFTETVATVNRYWELVELPSPLAPSASPSATSPARVTDGARSEGRVLDR
jgi:CheY-like chemotaxis protein